MYRAILIGYDGTEGARRACPRSPAARPMGRHRWRACIHGGALPTAPRHSLAEDAAQTLIAGVAGRDWLEFRGPGDSPPRTHAFAKRSRPIWWWWALRITASAGASTRQHGRAPVERLAMPVAVAPQGSPRGGRAARDRRRLRRLARVGAAHRSDALASDSSRRRSSSSGGPTARAAWSDDSLRRRHPATRSAEQRRAKFRHMLEEAAERSPTSCAPPILVEGRAPT